MDPVKPTKSEKEQIQNNVNLIQRNERDKNDIASKQTHPHSFTPQYYPFVHQHPQMLNRSHAHQLQSPLLLTIPSVQQMQYPNAAHRHFQYSTQYTVPTHENNDQYFSKNQMYVHEHVTRVSPIQHSENQVWVPQQPPPVTDKKLENKENVASQNKTQQKYKDGEKRKQINTQLRSPNARRPPDAPVTMQGWLHKQGSEGLMLWKKRWFVLSEYCLFYYKGSAEEKLLGSILLPSYKVSICKPEDKVNKKYAFKCEHANMRTYVLAADSQELLLQWVHVLSLACNLQTQNEAEKEKSESVTQMKNNIVQNTSNTQQQNSNTKKTPVHIHTSSNTTDLTNSTQQELNQYNQPLYANAPPKPRRLTDGGYSSPGSDTLDKYGYSQYVPPPVNFSKSPVDIYRQYTPTSQLSQPEYVVRVANDHMLREVRRVPQNIDRCTPDTYGRSNLTKYRNPSDYEDIYSDRSVYKRPMSPVIANNVKKVYPSVNLVYKTYSPVNMLGPPKEYNMQYDPVQMRKSPISVARPHSADFLEYKTNQRDSETTFLNVQQQRPKSSLDINKYSGDHVPHPDHIDIDQHRTPSSLDKGPTINDNYFYSQERYAEKMRKSAQYLHKLPMKYHPIDNSHRKHKERSPGPENMYPYGARSMAYNQTPVHMNAQPVRSRSVLSEGSLLCAQDIENESVSPDFSIRQESYQNTNNRTLMPDQFTRSASARLAQSNERVVDPNFVSMDGERKREESMKRLLEWKQRMLQSPLNRKAQTQGYRIYSSRPESNYGYQSCYAPASTEVKPKKTNLNTRTSLNSLVQYNSYSSDDEDTGKGSKKIMHSQAGRTVDTFPSNSDLLTHAQTDSTTAVLKEPAELSESLKTAAPDACEAELEEMHGNTLTKPLVEFNKDLSTIAHVSSLRSEYSDKFQSGSVTTEIKANDALVKSILSEFQIKSSPSNTPTKDIDALQESNYMPMSLKNSIFQTTGSNDFTLVEDEQDENHYVEMTQNLSIADSDCDKTNDQQQYEIVCFGESVIEPVYMELKGPNSCLKEKKTEELPDILKSQNKKPLKSNKSDSSDADDEASKDLDSLDDHNQPRFSLSDSFRPASYYLGVSKNVQEFQDSSDSELVSPPPIPTSPPPLEDDEFGLDISKIKRNKKDLHANRYSDQFLNMSRTKSVISVDRFSTQSLDAKMDLMSLKGRPNLLTYDPIDDGLSSMSLNSDSAVETQIPNRALRRRPVSHEFDNLLDNYHDENNSNKLQVLLKSMEMSEEADQSHDYENMLVSRHTSQQSSLLQASCTNPIDVYNLPQINTDEFIMRGRPDSRSSISAEISSFVANSNCSTPVISIDSCMMNLSLPSEIQEKYFGSPSSQVAPYYYSDLSCNTSNTDCSKVILTLNNQRDQTNIPSKKDITHIINPIKEQKRSFEETLVTRDKTFTLAAEARSASVDFLNLTDKIGSIDKKNIYESDTLKRQKALEVERNLETRNLYLIGKTDKFSTDDLSLSSKLVRKSHSLEGLLENALNERVCDLSTNRHADISLVLNTSNNEGSFLWEEDTVWRERLRSASQRHTKSLDDIDCLEDSEKYPKKSSRAITRDVTYVNDILFKPDICVEPQTKKFLKTTKNEITKKGSFLIDREKLRQWDLLSSAPSDDQTLSISSSQVPEGDNVVVELRESSAPREPENPAETASGSISITRNPVELQRDTFPRVAKKAWPPNLQNTQALSTTNLERTRKYENHRLTNQSPYELSQEDLKKSRNDLSSTCTQMNMSAGELLGRTHEELVLLLIQLRRQSAHTFQAIESCYNEIDKSQACHTTDQAKRIENLQKLEKIKQNLLELEKQYEKGRPLVNLVDNMVKLGSLYRIPPNRNDMARYIRDRLEFNQHVQERRLIAEEKREWNRLDTNHAQLHEKVQQLYQLDRLIQEESENLQNLQQDKEDIERALGGLRYKLNKGYNNPQEIEQARRQQAMLENELSRVHLMLAQNSKKLEETVAGNARLEQELLVLKQKLQISRQQRSSPQISNPGDSLPFSVGSSTVLESDLKRVQKKIGDLHKQREELSLQVRQLTDRSNNQQNQQKATSSVVDPFAYGKRRPMSVWRETDLDTMNIIDHGYSSDNLSCSTTPLYINTDLKNTPQDIKTSDSTSEDTTLSSSILEKQEIKTVRIVKRESERRQRDREKSSTCTSNTSNNKCDILVEEDDTSENSSVLFRPTSLPKTSKSIIPEKSPELSPVFKSEAARQIITEVKDTPKIMRRTIPREKRRHFTAPNNNLIAEKFNTLPADTNRLEARRARDDLDIERALRQRIDAPDIVRSTLSNKELKYNEETIDSILSTPNKILIPERYIPEQLPQLSPEEEQRRLRKVESIKKMLSDTAIISGASTSSVLNDEKTVDKNQSGSNKSTPASSSITEEKKQREHLLQLNQILAKQVMEMSKVVAVRNLAKLPLVPHQMSTEEDDSSPIAPLPLYQQRENFYS